MAKASPQQNVFEGELSPLAEGRTDLDRYPRGMRYLSNMVPCRTGPAIGRSGTYFENKCIEPAYPSKLLPFEYNEDEILILEFGHYLLRFHYEYKGLAANHAKIATQILAINPFKFKAPGHAIKRGQHIVFTNFPGILNVNGVIAKVTAVSGDDITTDYAANGTIATAVMTGNEIVGVVYEIATPYPRGHVKNIRLVQELNICYLFCARDNGPDFQQYVLHRHDTYNWDIKPFSKGDGPYMDINIENTFLVPSGTGTWIPHMTGASTPSGTASASSQVTGHEAWRAFDGDIDTYWESNTSQEGWLQYSFDANFINIIPNFAGPTSGAMTIAVSSAQTNYPGWKTNDGTNASDWRSSAEVAQWWRIDFGAAQTIQQYLMRVSLNKPEYSPRNWTLQGSTAAAGPWTTLDTRTNFQWDSGQHRVFTVQHPAAYRFYRINVTDVNNHEFKVTPTEPYPGLRPGNITITQATKSYVGIANIQMSVAKGTMRKVDGYTIYLGRYNKGIDVVEHAPKTFYFEGWDGNSWTVLDSKQGYTNYANYRSQYFPIKNPHFYKAYRLRIKTVHKAGDVNPRVGMLVMSSPDAPTITLRATSKKGINDDRGFQLTDVGRIIRVRDADDMWRWTTIASVTDQTHIKLTIKGRDPLVLENQVKFWRLGLWSATTGYPICGVLHEDRLFCGGSSGFPDTVVASRIGNHTNFRQSNVFDEVVDTDAFVARANNRFMSRIMWIKSAEEALRVGTGKYEFILSAPTDAALSARNLKIRTTTKRGSAMHEPATVDNDVIFLQKSQRALYAHTFRTSQADVAGSYKAPLMSKLGAHLMQPAVVQIVYQQEPHSVIWGRRVDGTIAAMTYSNDDDIFGGHRHSVGGFVADMCTIESPTDGADSLWLVVRRSVGGVNQYLIERLSRFWDYGDDLAQDAAYLDSSLRYNGTTATNIVYGLRHLEGRYLNVLADNIIYKNVGPVVQGALTLERAATTIVVGLPYVMEAEIIASELGAQDGTAQGKSKRPHSVVLRLWQSARGEVGRWDEDHGILQWTPCEYNYPADETVPFTTLRTVLTKTIVLPGGYGTLGTVRFRQTDPVPFNVVGVYPQTYVEDER